MRIAGKRSLPLLKKHFKSVKDNETVQFKPFLMHYGHFVKSENDIVDEILAVYMPSGKSYTGSDQVEIFCHGGRQVVQIILDVLIKSGARMAEPGEFTKMAFLAGRIDLAKAESVAEIISANTQSSYQTAREHLLGAYTEHISMLRSRLVDIIAEVEASIDFPEDDISPDERDKLLTSIDDIVIDIKQLHDSYKGGQIINEGYKIAIAGKTNAGKSSLFNLLLSQERALVTPTPGTTRDYLSEWIELEGFKVNIIDTAGLRPKGGKIEKAGQVSAMEIIKKADLVIWMVDLAQKTWKRGNIENTPDVIKTPKIILGNKIDTVNSMSKLSDDIAKAGIDVIISCKTKKGITSLKREIVKRINEKMPDLTSGVIVTSARHRQKLSTALKSIKTAKQKIKAGESPELTAFDLRLAIDAVDEITGKIYNEDILGKIFSKFCIGK